MKAQEHLETSVIICQSEGHNIPHYFSPRQNRCDNLISHNNGFISSFPISLRTGVSSLKEQEFSPNRKATFAARATCYIKTLLKITLLYISGSRTGKASVRLAHMNLCTSAT
jgi:hypothetical protein